MAARTVGRANLHLHTNFSDGELTPREVLDAHVREGFAAIAISDHDTLEGIDAIGGVEGHGLQLIPAVELSIEDEPQRGLVQVHLLGYGFELSDRHLRDRLAAASTAREEQKKETVARLARIGYRLDWDSVRSRARGNVGKPHIVAAIEALNPGVAREQLYRQMGPGGEANAPRSRDLSLDDAVALIAGAGGVTVLAHPGVYEHVPDLEVLFRTCAAAGVLGLEVTYPQVPDDPYGPESAAAMARFAERATSYGWVATGGDDFHGPAVTPMIRLAQWPFTPVDCVEALLARRP